MNDGIEPPDPQIAVSKTHVVVAAQRILGFFQKDGTPVGTTDYETFFQPLGLASGTDKSQGLPSFIGSDPRLIFDEYRKVFWLTHDGGNAGAAKDVVRGRIYVAVSKSGNPLGDPANPSAPAWNLYWWDAVAEWHVPDSKFYQGGDIADYPFIGVDPVAFYQTIAVCNRADPTQPNTPCVPRYSGMVAAPANDLVGGAPGQYKGSYFIFTDPNGNMMTGVVQPAVHHGTTNYAYFVGRWGTDQLLVWRLQSSKSTQPTQPTPKPASVTMTAPFPKFGQPQDVPQLGATNLIGMSNASSSALKVVFRKGFLHVVTNDAMDWFNDGTNLNSIRLVRASVSKYPTIPNSGEYWINRVFGMNNIFDDDLKLKPHMYYGWPAIEVNQNGDMIIVYARTGTTIYPQARFSAYYNTESDIRPSRLLHAGDGPYNGVRWGDLAGASVDPEDDTSIWIVHQYATKLSGNNWGLWVGKVTP
jgi:hypothetical protein